MTRKDKNVNKFIGLSSNLKSVSYFVSGKIVTFSEASVSSFVM